MSGYRYDRIKVLVIDDNEHMRSLIGTILLAIGIRTIFEAPDATSGWKILTQTPCDIVFVDWVLEGESGLDFTKRLRTAPDSPNAFVPVIMVSSHTSLDRVQAARDVGVNEFLAKPVSSKAVLSKLASLIDNPRPFVRTKSYFGPCRRRRTDEYHGPERRIEPSKPANPQRNLTASAA